MNNPMFTPVVEALLMHRVTLLIAALLVNALLMGPRGWYVRLRIARLAQWPATLIRDLERRLNRDRRSQDERRRRGAVLVFVLMFLCIALAAGFAFATTFFLYGPGVEVALMAMLLGVRQTHDYAAQLQRWLESGDIGYVRDTLEEGPWRNASMLDAHGLSRAAVETTAVAYAEKVVSPALWYLVLGIPGLCAARLTSLLADTIGRNRASFGWAADRLGWFVHYIPTLLASLLLVAASVFLPFSRPLHGIVAWARTLVFPSNHARLLTCAGAVLNLALGGPASVYAPGNWIGGAVARAHTRDIRRAIILFWLASFLLLACLGLLWRYQR
jgi:adenosylcobinamide-phosphate synthase